MDEQNRCEVSKPPTVRKVPMRNSERVALVSSCVPYLAQFLDAEIIGPLRDATFVSSRATGDVLELVEHLSNARTAAELLSVHLTDTIDDEVRDVAIAASVKTAQSFLRKGRVGVARCEPDDDAIPSSGDDDEHHPISESEGSTDGSAASEDEEASDLESSEGD